MILKVNELPANLCCIYKINYPNHKIYIGCTVDLKRRMREHNKNAHKVLQPCDAAIKKYGEIEEIEILEFINDISLMEEKERYWISFYNAQDKNIGYNLTPGGNACNQYGVNNTQAVFSDAEVLDIRKRRFLHERKKDVYKDYSDKNFQSFERIWLGRGYPTIGQEYLIPAHTKTRQEYSHEANAGTNNGRAKCSKEEVLDIRAMFDNGISLAEIYQKYSYKLSKSTVRRIALRESYKIID